MKLIVSEQELLDLSGSALHHARDTDIIDSLGSQLGYRGYPGEPVEHFYSPPKTWEALKEEFRILVCTKDKKYSSLRKKLGTTGAKSQTMIVSMIAAAMAPPLGVAVSAVLVPFCALVLLGLLKVGKEAYCRTTDLNIPVGTASPIDHTRANARQDTRSQRVRRESSK
jgi:hypothetical protein